MDTQFDTSKINLSKVSNPNAQDFSAGNMAYLAHCARAIYQTDTDG